MLFQKKLTKHARAYVYVCVCMLQHTCGIQSTTCESQSSPCAYGFQGRNAAHQPCLEAPLHTEPSGQPQTDFNISPHFIFSVTLLRKIMAEGR